MKKEVMRNTYLKLESKHYDPREVENHIYQLWEEHEMMSGKPDSGKKPFSVVIPPPNVTGRLHMGHALNNTVQDVLIRYKRMAGYDAVWIPGTDHAGISTQSVVKKHLDAEGIDYLTLGREKMLERIWEWKDKYGDQILMQLRRMGCSCDWSRKRFTMDQGLSKAVRTAFVRFYEDGLIYRGKYIVNWCPVDRTALSDDEVITADGGEPGHLWHIRYPLSDGSGSVIVATTRPETMLGDTAVAVNPKDERYRQLIGRMVDLPLCDRRIPIIADEYVDRSFGSGCLKVTPAHDPNDFQIAFRHNLPKLNIMNEDATIGDQAPAKYHGLDRFRCREVVVNELKQLGLLIAVEDRMTPVGRAQRSRAIIEYRLSSQWFVKMPELAKKALAASEAGEIQLFPERWERIYRDWLINTRDWCISRQIWWGHRIPAWYHLTSDRVLVAQDTPQEVLDAPDEWQQDEDVLDTWFSSALWPYSTLGWPDQSADLAKYYPTSVLSTAKDIIYFWVARMVMTGIHLAGEVPFRKVYFHPVICDANGETMSKSKGNGIDPLHIIDGAAVAELEGPIREARPENMEQMLAELHRNYPDGYKAMGADALRFTLLSLNSQAQQVQLSLQKFEEIGQRFIDKLWNASRFVLSGFADGLESTIEPSPLALEDRWILGKLDRTTGLVAEYIDTFRFSDAVSLLYKFFWEDVCDWYLELSKSRLKAGTNAEERARVQMTLLELFSSLLRLLHPFTPFITEELWGHLLPLLKQMALDRATSSLSQLCALSAFPEDLGRYDQQLEADFELLRATTIAIRNMRSNAQISPQVQLAAYFTVKDDDTARLLNDGRDILMSSAKLKSFTVVLTPPEGLAVAVLEKLDAYVNLAEHMDLDAERKRNEIALRQAEKDIAQFKGKLENANFIAKAPAAIVEAQRQSLAEAQQRKKKIEQTLRELS